MIKAEVCTRISFNSQKWGIIWGTRNKKRLTDHLQGVLSVDGISPLQSLISFRRARLASCRCRGDEISLVPRLFSCRCRGGPCKLVWRLKARTASGFCCTELLMKHSFQRDSVQQKALRIFRSAFNLWGLAVRTRFELVVR